MRNIGLTGGIGCGKTTVLGLFEALGARLLIADDLAKEVVSLGSPILSQIFQIFGKSLANLDGSLNRSSLAKIVFSDSKALAELNALTHPAIDRLRQEKLGLLYRDNPQATVLCEVPLLFETGMESRFQKTILITASQEVRIQRLMDSRGMSRTQITSRMAQQWPDEKKAPLADFLIDNGKDLEQTKAQVLKLWKQLQALPQVVFKPMG